MATYLFSHKESGAVTVVTADADQISYLQSSGSLAGAYVEEMDYGSAMARYDEAMTKRLEAAAKVAAKEPNRAALVDADEEAALVAAEVGPGLADEAGTKNPPAKRTKK